MEQVTVDEPTIVRTGVEQGSDPSVRLAERPVRPRAVGDGRPPARRRESRPIGDPVEEPRPPRRRSAPGAAHRREVPEQSDHGRGHGVGLVGAHVLEEATVVPPGDGEPPVEPLADGQHLGDRHRRRAVRLGRLVSPEPVGRIGKPQHELVAADPVGVRGRPEPTTERDEIQDIDAVVCTQEGEYGPVGRSVVGRSSHDRRLVLARPTPQRDCGQQALGSTTRPIPRPFSGRDDESVVVGAQVRAHPGRLNP